MYKPYKIKLQAGPNDTPSVQEFDDLEEAYSVYINKVQVYAAIVAVKEDIPRLSISLMERGRVAKRVTFVVKP